MRRKVSLVLEQMQPLGVSGLLWGPSKGQSLEASWDEIVGSLSTPYFLIPLADGFSCVY